MEAEDDGRVISVNGRAEDSRIRIYVGGLGGSVTEFDLKKTFSSTQMGLVDSVEVVRSKGRSFAYLDFVPFSDKGLSTLFSKVKRRNSEESSTQWTTGIAEIQLPMEYKLKNIEETEAAKKLLQEKRLVGRTKTESTIPSSYSADYFQRGKDYAERLRREHPELYKGEEPKESGLETSRLKGEQEKAPAVQGKDQAGQRQAATDEFMLERFRRRERHRGMRR